MKKLIFLLSAIWLMLGCSTEESANVPDGMLSKIDVQPFAGSSYVTRFYYNGHKIDRTESSNNTHKIYYYDGNLIVNVKSYSDTFMHAEERFSYDGTGNLIQMDRIEYLQDSHSRQRYTYNPDQTLTVHDFQVDASGQEILSGTRLLSFENGRLSTEVVVFEANPTQSIRYQYSYDDKPVPYRDIVGFEKINAFSPLRYNGSVNNLIWVEEHASGSAETTTYGTIFTYNENGMPASSAADDSGTVITDNGSMSYFYK